MSFQEIVDRVEAHLVALDRFQAVEVGEPPAINADKTIAFWYAGDTLEFETFTDRNVAERLIIRGFWLPGESPQRRKQIEIELQEASQVVIETLVGDSTLGGAATDLKIGGTVTGWGVVGNAGFRMFTIEVRVVVYEREAIAP